VFGLNNGLIPVLAYNYGAQDRARIDEALSFSVRLAIAIMLVGTFTFEVFPTQLLGLFNASENMRAIGITALRIIGIHFPLAGACITLGSVFQAFARSIYSLIISIARQLLVLIPVAWLLGRIFGTVSAVWWAFPIAETASLLLSILFFRKVYREVVEKL
jgi:Na+-driven multidrug efflux pump